MTTDDVNPVKQTALFCGRYVLQPDGTLHQGVPPTNLWGSRWLPPETRTLGREEVAQVWSLSQQMGFTDPSRGDPRINLGLIKPTAGEVTYILAYAGGQERWNFVRSNKLNEPGDPAVTQVVEKLAELSWTSPTSQPAGYIMPPRYEFGPDPYSKYRQPADK